MTAREVWNSVPKFACTLFITISWVVFPVLIYEVAPSGGVLMMRRIRGKALPRKAVPPSDPKIQEERQRIAEDIARALREAGYECSDDSIQPTLRRDN